MAKVKIIKVYIKEVDLEKLRKKSGLSLRDLGNKAKVSFSHIHKIENGLVMSETTWNKLKKVLDKYTNK